MEQNDPEWQSGGMDGCFAAQVPGVRVISALAPSDGAMEPSMKVGDSSWKSVMLDDPGWMEEPYKFWGHII